MLLHNVRLTGEESAEAKDILLQNDCIAAIAPAGSFNNKKYHAIDCSGAIVLPGMINSHEHLDFNLFPQLGSPFYTDYIEWGNHIHTACKETIAAVLKVPLHLRIQWGMYKNLLNGFTTVVNHGSYLPVGNPTLTIHQPRHNLHSAGFEKKWKWLLNRPSLYPGPYVMHAGEGTSETAGKEINRWIRYNFFRKKMVAVHGVAMKPLQAKHFRALVWCPASNFFMFGKTAEVDELKKYTTLLFGTDSTLTAGWNAWDHFAMAMDSGKIQEAELLNALTAHAATVWNMKNKGRIATGCQADLLVTDYRPTGSVLQNQPRDIRLLVQKGRIVLADAGIWLQLKERIRAADDYSPVCLQGKDKYVYGNLPALVKEIRTYYAAADFSMLSEPDNER